MSLQYVYWKHSHKDRNKDTVVFVEQLLPKLLSIKVKDDPPYVLKIGSPYEPSGKK